MKRLKQGSVAVIATLLVMVVVFVTAKEINTHEWASVEAKAVSTQIERQRIGGPAEWCLLVDYEYAVSGSGYTGRRLRVFSDLQRPVTETEQKAWHKGKTFPVFYRVDSPEQSSLAADGGRDALAVLCALLVPMIMVVALLAMIVIKRRRRA